MSNQEGLQIILPEPRSTRERVRDLRTRRARAMADRFGNQGTRPSQSMIPTNNEVTRDPRMNEYWNKAATYFKENFIENKFGAVCGICDRLWFHQDLREIKNSHYAILEEDFGAECRNFKACATCYRLLDEGRMPSLSRSNGFEYPPKPPDLPALDPISARLIAPRLPFMQIRRLRWDNCARAIIGQVINVPVDVDKMIRSLPRQLSMDRVINVVIKRKLIHRSHYLKGYVQKETLFRWLNFLKDQPLYKHYDIRIDFSTFDQEGDGEDQEREVGDTEADELIEGLNEIRSEVDILIARQHTMLWNEENVLEIAPGQGVQPLNIIYDEHAEELSFPGIYYGCGRSFKRGVRVTPFMMATSETRRTDRRGVTPEHLLYMAMKIMRLRVVDGIYHTFKCVESTEKITRQDLESSEFVDELVERNLSFLKSIPNSAYYWRSCKKELFAMIRQWGKPTGFLTISAREGQWAELLQVLQKLSDEFSNLEYTDIIADLDPSTKSALVNNDPVTCCIYFHKLLEVFMRMLCAKKNYNPFGKYRVIDYFQRIEFQHRGSPHAHILVWLEHDPKEPVSEDMPETIKLMTDLCSVSTSDVDENIYKNQLHRHTPTCYKRGEKLCRFNIPYWPMNRTRTLLPMAKEDGRLNEYRARSRELREKLETRNYDSLSSFLYENRLDEQQYLNIIRSSLTRPTFIFKRGMSDLRTNTFNPCIAALLNSNMDLQIILEGHSCAAYVVDYVNKSERGLSNLHRELVKLSEENPEMTYDRLLKRLGSKILNSVEMTTQEAAWYLLRQPMSQFSRDVIYIPTCWPCERQKSCLRKSQLANLDPDSTDIWTKSLIEKYQDRPEEIKDLCLADFAAWYTATPIQSNKTNYCQDDADLESCNESVNQQFKYRKRQLQRTIRYRNYDMADTLNYKREMVTLYVPFKNEHIDLLDRNKFLMIFDEQIEVIAQKRQEYNRFENFEQIMEEYRQLNSVQNDEVELEVEREIFARQVLEPNQDENFDDLEHRRANSNISAITTRSNVMTKDEFCSIMRKTNREQRELLLEIIHRIHQIEKKPIQIFFTGPAGCGKTFVLKLMMEIYNRYSQRQNCINNSYIACASTGKASSNLGGSTVHSAFHITPSRRATPIGRETLQSFRGLFDSVSCVIVDEVSMVSSAVLHQVNQRLQLITGDLVSNFGGMDIVFCGDFRQLPPVKALPVYKGSRSHLESALLWQSLDFFCLNRVMRQSDVLFSSILTKIGNGLPLINEEAKVIESRFRTNQWCTENLVGVVRLYHRNNHVDAYNRNVVQGGIEHVAKDTVVGHRNDEELALARTKLHRMSTTETTGLPYILTLSIGYPYMITTNIDIEDGIVNGTVGTLKYVERLPQLAESSENQERLGEDLDDRLRVWLEFPTESIGAKSRIKCRPIYMRRRGEIESSWTAIEYRSASIKLSASMRCRRIQFPLVLACAMTIHKSQGGTFDRVVIQYDKNMQTQLVYVALSRVQSLEGLFLVNERDEFIFYHKRGSSSPSIIEIRDEYARLQQHRLPTLTDEILKFLKRETDQRDIIICTMNAQSLLAHREDIETDEVISMNSDILAITETWMDNSRPINIENFELVAHDNNSLENRDSTYQHEHNSRRTAGGVAIYKRVCSPIYFDALRGTSINRLHGLDRKIGDHVAVNIEYDGNKIALHVIYIHPNISKDRMKRFLIHTLGNPEDSDGRQSVVDSPMIVTGDFNCNVVEDRWIIDIMKRKFDLNWAEISTATTLGRTRIDLTFTRCLNIVCKAFVSYFSYHRPIFGRIKFND